MTMFVVYGVFAMSSLSGLQTQIEYPKGRLEVKKE